VTDAVVLDFGKHLGTPITRVPRSYLRWMVGVGTPHADAARAELERRGTRLPTIEVSGHAIDRASQRCLKLWRKSREGDEGLYSWLARIGMEAWLKRTEEDQVKVRHLGRGWIFELDCQWPVLKTVTPS